MARVLVVDDERSVRCAVGAVLGRDGHEITLAATGLEAQEILSTRLFDVVVTDIVMPDVSGMEVLNQARRQCPDTQVLIITGQPSMDTATQSIRDGAFDYLCKPVRPDDMRRAVRRAADHKRVIDENRRLTEENAAYQAGLESLVSKQTEELRLRANRYQALFCESHVGIYELDKQRECVTVNGRWCELTGIPAGAAAGDGWMHAFHPDDRAAIVDRVQMACRRGQPCEIAGRVLARDGRVLRVEGSVTPVRDARALVCGYIGTIIDVTDREEAADALRRANESLEQEVADRTADLSQAVRDLDAFASRAAHDLRGPLRIICGFVGMLTEDFGGQLPAEAQRQLQVIKDRASGMSVLVEDLLAFARLGKERLRCTQAPMSDLVMAAIEEQTRQTNGHPAEVVVGDLPDTYGDPVLLRQVWCNLISNALKFTRSTPSARVEIWGVQEGERTVYSVRDNGAGFDMAEAPKLFAAFQRLHAPSEYEGTGLGLAIVRSIVERHGGTVWATGTVGGGATFSFALAPAEASCRMPHAQQGVDSCLVAA